MRTNRMIHGLVTIAIAVAALAATVDYARAQGNENIAAILARPHPLADVAPNGLLPRIAKVLGAQPIQETQARTLFDGHLTPDLALEPAVRTDGPSMTLGADGHSVTFVNHAAARVANITARGVTPRASDLPAVATDFLEHKLLTDATFKALFPLGPQETLKLTDSYSRVAAVYSPTQATGQLVSRAFVFSRHYAGVPFLGPGHKVVITVTPGKKIVGLEILLPRLAAAVGDPYRIMGRDAFKSKTLAAAQSTAGDEFFKSEVKGLRCGYFDPESPANLPARTRAGAAAVIEPVCVVDRAGAGRGLRIPARRLVISLAEN